MHFEAVNIKLNNRFCDLEEKSYTCIRQEPAMRKCSEEVGSVIGHAPDQKLCY